MAKSNAAKTNGHTVTALKPAAPKKPAAKPPAKPAAKAAAKPVAKPAVKPAAKPAAKAAPAAKPAPRRAAAPAEAPASLPVAATSKRARKPAARPAAKPDVKTQVKAAVPGQDKTAGAEDMKEKKSPKAKLVRDSFTMPEQEYAVLGQVKKACIKAGFEVKKSELLRIGVALISQLDMATLQRVLDSLPQLKTGRPKKD